MASTTNIKNLVIDALSHDLSEVVRMAEDIESRMESGDEYDAQPLLDKIAELGNSVYHQGSSARATHVPLNAEFRQHLTALYRDLNARPEVHQYDQDTNQVDEECYDWVMARLSAFFEAVDPARRGVSNDASGKRNAPHGNTDDVLIHTVIGEKRTPQGSGDCATSNTTRK